MLDSCATKTRSASSSPRRPRERNRAASRAPAFAKTDLSPCAPSWSGTGRSTDPLTKTALYRSGHSSKAVLRRKAQSGAASNQSKADSRCADPRLARSSRSLSASNSTGVWLKRLRRYSPGTSYLACTVYQYRNHRRHRHRYPGLGVWAWPWRLPHDQNATRPRQDLALFRKTGRVLD